MARLSEEEKNGIRKDYESGDYTVAEIAERYEVSGATVYNVCKQSPKKKAKKEEAQEEAEEVINEIYPEEDSEGPVKGTAAYWEAKANFWKGKYLETWADLLEFGEG